MKHSRVVILGIDGMDFDYVSNIQTQLPSINKLSKIGIVTPFQSVFPPDSIPSWITCYTGKDPSEHGILGSVNYLANPNDQLCVDTSAFQGKTFWDIIGQSGYTVCIVNPFMAYPVWPVNGLMISGPVYIDGNIQISDSTKTEDIDVPNSFGGIVDFPSKRSLSDFIDKTFSETAKQAEFGLNVIKKYRPDLFFQTFLNMDRIQHFLWRYCDMNDPTYPGTNPHERSIKKFYIFIDQLIGQFIKTLGPDDRIIVISDHGHGMRCTHCFNINELLRKHGYVKSVADGKIFCKELLLEITKNYFLHFLNEHNMEDCIRKIAKFIPNAKKIKKGRHITKSSANKAYASDFAGTNPFGGICINKELVDDYDEIRTKLISLLLSVKSNGERIFEWICKREEIFNGEFLERFPDILFCLKSQYGVSWNLHTKEFTVNPTHKKISGGHKTNGIFFSNIPMDRFINPEYIKMTNFFSTILNLFGIEVRELSRGRSFVKN